MTEHDQPTEPQPEPLPNVHQAIAAAMASVRAVGKWGQNQEQGYAFRSIDHFMTALNPAMAKAGVHVVPRVIQRIVDDTHTTSRGSVQRWVDMEVAFAFYGPDGSCVEAVAWGEARDSADKATNKAMTAAFKYAIMQVFMVPTQDLQDADATTPEDATRGQRPGPARPPQDPEQARRAEAERAAVARDIARADADEHTVTRLRGDVLMVADTLRGEDRLRALRSLWDDARNVGALGCTVVVPEAWRADNSDPVTVTLHQLLGGARNEGLPPSSEAPGGQEGPDLAEATHYPESETQAQPAPSGPRVERATGPMDDDPWAAEHGPRPGQDGADYTPTDPDTAQKRAQQRARSERKGSRA